VLQNRPPPGRTLERTPVFEAVLRDRGAPRIGPDDADVVIVVFTDYRCAVCRRTDPALARLLQADPGVRVHYKDWPILGEQSQLGARVALAAHRQGRYLPMHQALMAERGPLTGGRVRELAAAVGVNSPQLEADLASKDIDEQLTRHANQAFSLGLRGTPAYLVGPKLIEGGLDDRALARAVAQARKAAS
jgi:protein-disulfide isomerase